MNKYNHSTNSSLHVASYERRLFEKKYFDNIRILVIVFYISFLLMTYSFDSLFKGIRLSNIINLSSFRIALIIGSYLLCFRIFFGKPLIGVSLNKQDLLLFLFFFSLLLSFFWSVNRIETIKKSYGLFYLIWFYFVLLALLKEEKVFISTYYYFLFSPFVYLLLVSTIYLISGTVRGSSVAPGAFPNFVASSVTITIPFLYSQMLEGKKMIKIISYLSFTSVLIVILMCISRSSLLIAIIMTSLYFLVYVFAWKKVKAKSLLLFILIFIIAVTVVGLLRETTVSFSDRLKNLNAITEESRYRLYKINFDMIKEKPIWGYGFGTHSLIVRDKYNLLREEGKLFSSHNVIVTIWTGSGIVSVLIFSYFTLHLYKKGRLILFPKNFKISKENLFYLSIYISLFGLLLEGMLRGLLYNPNFYFLLALGSIAIRFEGISKNPKRKK